MKFPVIVPVSMMPVSAALSGSVTAAFPGDIPATSNITSDMVKHTLGTKRQASSSVHPSHRQHCS